VRSNTLSISCIITTAYFGRCGRRLVKEILALKEAHPNLQQISFIGVLHAACVSSTPCLSAMAHGSG
jgi:hypothetical protein